MENKLEQIRHIMLQNNISACIIPTGDPHCSEYLPTYYKIREWVSGFTGSAGILVVTQKNAAIWIDSRYYIQAENELKNSNIFVMKDGLEDTPSIPIWLKDNVKENNKISINAELISYKKFEKLKEDLQPNLEIINFDIISIIWTHRPKLPTGKVFKISDSSTRSIKLKKLSNLLFENRQVDMHVITSPAQICWLLNLRGSDIKYTPVFLSYMIITKNENILFVHEDKLSQKIKNSLIKDSIKISKYDNFYNYIKKISDDKNNFVLIDSNTLNAKLYDVLNKKFSIAVDKVSPIDKMKSIKTNSEIAGIKKGLHKDSIALCKLIYNLEDRISDKITEQDISIELCKLKAKDKDFIEESFETISAYKENAAIVHYAPGEDSKPLEPHGFLLIDTGTQYLHGTTDSTRTIALGKLTDEEKFAYTVVLKSHIAMACARFPKGTTGIQLDTFAKMHHWNHNMNFTHGTGHGVGFCLSVHEGPNSISPRSTYEFAETGLITTIEPGYYKENEFGIRLENMTVSMENNGYLYFETINFFPFEIKALKLELLTENEIHWLNSYHAETYARLAPFLRGPIAKWLKKATREIKTVNGKL